MRRVFVGSDSGKGKRTVLVVDDESDIVDMVKSYLEMSGYLVMTASTGKRALEQAKRGPDAIILDRGLPDVEGLSVCEQLRETTGCPIIFLTAKVETADEIDGFSVGADDYVTKPFSLEVLGARLRAQLAREERARSPILVRVDDALSIDFAAKSVLVNGERVPLARKDYEICALLAKHPGQVFDKDMIYENVWGEPGDSLVVTEHVRRLRRALADAGAAGEYVSTVWGVGYAWRA